MSESLDPCHPEEVFSWHGVALVGRVHATLATMLRAFGQPHATAPPTDSSGDDMDGGVVGFRARWYFRSECRPGFVEFALGDDAAW
jgi:hypothetical protein